MSERTNTNEPSLFRWALSLAASIGIAGMLCCVAPMVLFMLGLMGGVYAISFADFFYQPDGAPGIGAWVLRGLAVVVGLVGVVLYHRKQNQCSLDPKRQQKNLILLVVMMTFFGLGAFLSLEALSSWYFDELIQFLYNDFY